VRLRSHDLRTRRRWAQGLAAAIVVVLISGAGGAIGASKRARSADAVPASTDGVTSKAVTIVFPIVDLGAASGAAGLQYQSDETAQLGINTYVKAFNDTGGVNGRKINPRIVKFNPLKPTEMRALCKDWTTGGEVFAVVEPIGTWYGNNQLCLTQEGHLPLIASWTTVTEWTKRGAPYLWWTGPDQVDIVKNLTNWAIGAAYLTKGKKFAILSGDTAGDDLAVNKYLVPFLKKKGLEPTLVAKISASIDDPATAATQAKSVVTRLKSEGVETVIPLLEVYPPFQAYLGAAKAQDYRPRLLLSDYENSVSTALGLAEFNYPDLVGDQVGPTVYTYSNEDDDRPNGMTKLSGTGYTPEATACWQTYQKLNPKRINKHPWIEAQGPTMRWCDAVNILKKAFELAGKNLNRRTFVNALAKIRNFPVALTQAITFGPNDHSGPSTFRVVKPIKNDQTAQGNRCPPRRHVFDDPPNDPKNDFHGSCWLLVDDYKPLDTS
jgi:ABC-type branched-subunit amino acid transport system substrate-binding protein